MRMAACEICACRARRVARVAATGPIEALPGQIGGFNVILTQNMTKLYNGPVECLLIRRATPAVEPGRVAASS